MAQIIDQIVKVSIQDSVSGVTTTDVNTVALVGTSDESGASAQEIASAEGAETAFGKDSQLASMARAFFAQDSQPSRAVCVPAGSDALASAKAAAKAFGFYHVCLSTGDAEVSAETLAGWQEWLADAKKVLHAQVSPEKADALKSHGNDRVAVYVHAETHGTGKEHLHVAIVALRCAADSARGTFAHKTCKGVTADSYTAEEYAAMTDAGLNVYSTVAGEARLFMGTTGSATDFIDQAVKDDWIRFNVQSRIFRLLGEANDGHGVNYDDAGIGAVAAAVLNVLNVAADTDHQYVMDGSASVDYRPYSYLKENYAEDVQKRNLPLVSGRYARMNSIHTVRQVTLQVTL